jgi:hypothetical protein
MPPNLTYDIANNQFTALIKLKCKYFQNFRAI